MGKLRSMAEGAWFNCQWPEVLKLGQGYNWVNFDFIKLTFEFDKIMSCLEVEYALLGLSGGIRLYIGRSEAREEMARQARLAQAGCVETVPIGEIGGMEVMATGQAAEMLGKLPPDVRREVESQLAREMHRLKSKQEGEQKEQSGGDNSDAGRSETHS